jgi:Lipopolysaccharide kinase (Kdo/WaaP) family
METEMFKEQRGKWHWVLREAGILDSWFDDYQSLAESNAVKRNPVRTVFRYNDYFIKLDTPEKLLHKLRGRLRPKAKIEFKTALELEKYSVPVVEHLGWGQCDGNSMLITRALPNAVTVMDYWKTSFVYGNNDPSHFLEQFGEFLQTFFASRCYHPDFHPGNILYNPENSNFALVDLYGIKPNSKPLSVNERIKMYAIINCLRAVVSDAAAITFIDKLGLKLKDETSEELWQQLLDYKLSRIRNEWPKRKKQIINEYDKFVTRSDDASGKYLFRHNQNRQPYIKPELPLNTTAPKLYPTNLPTAEAEQLWLNSFLTDFLGDKQNMPLVWCQRNNSNDSIIYFQKKL